MLCCGEFRDLRPPLFFRVTRNACRPRNAASPLRSPPPAPPPPSASGWRCRGPDAVLGLDIIKAHGLDRKADLRIETLELASTEAGKIALKGGSADVMLSDWLWVARERTLGDNLVFYPSSSTLGAVMTPARSPINEIADLKGRKLAIAGGPLDKSWLLLQGLARRAGIDPGGRRASCTARRRSCPKRRYRASTTRR